MNLGSWIVALIVAAVLALAVRATFFKKSDGCCGCSHEKTSDDANANAADDAARDMGLGCKGCSACQSCASQKNCLQPTIKML